MTTSTDYITEQEFLDYYKSGASTGDQVIETAIHAASREIDSHCGRHFYTVTETRYFSSQAGYIGAFYWLEIDDLSTTSGLVVHTDTDASGSYAGTITYATDFLLEPVNQRQSGIRGWPYTALRMLSSHSLPVRYFDWQPDTVKITGTFGWAAVPDPVKQACKVLTAQYVKMSDAPLGVAGFGSYGDIKVKDIPMVASLLQPYQSDAGFGIA